MNMTYKIVDKTDPTIIAEIGAEQAASNDEFFAVYNGDNRIALVSVATAEAIYSLVGSTADDVAQAYISMLTASTTVTPTLEDRIKALEAAQLAALGV
jgi:hypothetical protein